MQKSKLFDFCRRYKMVLFSLFMLAFFILTIYKTQDIRLLVIDTTVNARFWPTVICWGGIILSVLMLIQGIMEAISLKRIEAEAQEQEQEQEKEQPGAAGARLRSLMTLCLMFVYILLLEQLGFLLTTALYLILQIMVLSGKKERKLWKILLISVAFAVVIYFIFRYGFKMMLPTGRLWDMMGR